jgi:signal transduction histidine kinase
MRDRASGVGGTLTVESEPDKGTTIEMEVPGG